MCVSFTVLFLTFNILRLSAMSQINVSEIYSTAIIRVNAVRNPKSLIIYIYTHTHSLKNQSTHHCLVVNGLQVNKEVGKWDQNVIRSVQPNNVLHDLSSKQDTQGLHTLCMLNFKLTCTVFSHNGLLPTVNLLETCPPCSSTVNIWWWDSMPWSYRRNFF